MVLVRSVIVDRRSSIFFDSDSFAHPSPLSLSQKTTTTTTELPDATGNHSHSTRWGRPVPITINYLRFWQTLILSSPTAGCSIQPVLVDPNRGILFLQVIFEVRRFDFRYFRNFGDHFWVLRGSKRITVYRKWTLNTVSIVQTPQNPAFRAKRIIICPKYRKQNVCSRSSIRWIRTPISCCCSITWGVEIDNSKIKI